MRGPVEAADQVQQGRFAGARGADDGDHLALRYVQRNVIESSNDPLPVEAFGYPGKIDHGYFYDVACRTYFWSWASAALLTLATILICGSTISAIS